MNLYLWQGMGKTSYRTGIIESGPWQLEYLVYGTGEHHVLAFHGFDNSAADFAVFQKVFGHRCTFTCVNLFYHGNSSCSIPADEAHFTADELKKVIGLLCSTLDIDRFSLLGYSLGGRICLQLIALFPERISGMMLLAPDGLRLSRWYRFVTSNAIGRLIFKRTVHQPQRFLATARRIRSLRLVGEKQYKFVTRHFDSADKRRKVYNVWMIFRYLVPDIPTIRSLIMKYRIPVELYFGKRDTIIPAAFADAINLKNQELIRVHILDAGHQLMAPHIVTSIEEKTRLFK